MRLPPRFLHACRALLCLLACAGAAPAWAALDVRMMVDVSREAQGADPGGARIAALRMFIDLLPAGSRAGIWSYGDTAQALMPPATVDMAWRTKARQAVLAIDAAPARYSDPAAGLLAATESWRSGVLIPAERHVILIGDGTIDVAGDGDAVAATRARIVRELLPLLQGTGAALHTIELSDAADLALLTEMSAATGGQVARIDPDEMPEESALRVFEQSMRPLMLPVHEGANALEFAVDGDVRELAVLTLARPGAAPPRLLGPDGSEPADLFRRREPGYELAVATQPAAGTWHIEGPAAGDVRALILSDLGLAAGPLPARIPAGISTELRAGVLAFGRVVDRKALHHALRIEVGHPGDDGNMKREMLLDNGRDGDAAVGDGVYTTRLPGMPEGRHDVTIEADGTIFQRLRRLPVEAVASPAAMVFERNERGATLYVLPYGGLVQPDTLQAAITVTAGGAYAGRYRAVRFAPNEWRIDLSAFNGAGPYELVFEASAERVGGGEMHFKERPRRFGPAGLEAPRPVEEPVAAPPAPTGPNWRFIGLVVMTGNVTIGFVLLLAIAIRHWVGNTAPARRLAELTPTFAAAAHVLAPDEAGAEAGKDTKPGAKSAGASATVGATGKARAGANPGFDAFADPGPAAGDAAAPESSPGTDAGNVMAEIAADAAAEENAKLREKVERATRSAKAGELSGDPLEEIDVSDIDLDFEAGEDFGDLREAV